MTARSKLEALSSSITKLNASIDKMVDEISTLQASTSSIVSQIIEDENLLKDSVWDIKHYTHGTYIEYTGSIDDSIMEPIVKLCNDSFHTWLDMEDGIQLRVDEDVISFHFDEPKTILPFVNKHKIKLVGNNLNIKLQELKRESSALEKLMHQFAIKS